MAPDQSCAAISCCARVNASCTPLKSGVDVGAGVTVGCCRTSLRLGAKGFLAKPINRDELLNKVRTVIAVARRASLERAEPAATAEPLPLRR